MLATILGTVIGLARLSSNWLVAKLAQIYVETFRNIPLPLQLLFWWALLRGGAPAPRQAWEPLPGIFVSNRGIVFPVPAANPAYLWMGLALVVGIAAAVALRRWATRRQEAYAASHSRPAGPSLGLVLGLPARVFLAAGAAARARRAGAARLQFRRRHRGVAGIRRAADRPGDLHRQLYRRDRARRHPRGQLGPERGGDGAGAEAGQRMRLVVLPQALRVIIPPMTSEYLSLTKNSSLAVIIGYPDLVSIANTTMNQTGQAVEGITMIMAVYLVISLAISLAMNLYNRAVALVER